MSDSIASIPLSYRLVASLPLRLRRNAVKAIFVLKSFGNVSARRRIAGRGGATSVHVFQRVLRLSRREALRLDRAAVLHDLSAEVEWLALSTRSSAAVRRDMAHVRVRDPEVLARVAEAGRPVILAPLHMGAYVIGICHLMLHYFPGRPLLVLRQRDDLVMETQVMKRISEYGVEIRFLNVTDRSGFLSAIRFAQKGAVMVVFCDLPPSYGAPAPMPMFGMPMSFAFGVDTLARLTGGTVVPWSTVMEPGGDTIRIGRPFEVQGNSAEERARVADVMRDHIRDTLRAWPEQWHLWSTLADYLPEDATLRSEPTDEAGGTLRDAA